MGEAKRRGTRTERIADAGRRADERYERERAEIRAAFTRYAGLPADAMPSSAVGYRCNRAQAAAILAALLAQTGGMRR